MNIDAQLRLSFYQEKCTINEKHGVKLVRHVDSGEFLVLKKLTIYDLHVFEYLRDNPVPGVPRVRELIEDEDTLYVIEEFVSGVSLRYRLDSGGPMASEEALELVRQLCLILRPLHSLSPPIVHRDIKPDNLILTPGDRLMLVDFNSAKQSHVDRSQDTVLIGTAGYAAPEQYGFSASQPTADIYAIGVLLNELLTGHMPQTQRYSGPLAPVLNKCLQMDPVNRYQSVDELLAALSIQKTPAMSWASRLRPWLPPGFRSGSPLRILGGALWYYMMFTLSFFLTVKGEETPADLFWYRATFFSVLLSETLWLGNYRNIWARLPWSRSAVSLFRYVGVALWALVLGFSVLLIGALLAVVFA